MISIMMRNMCLQINRRIYTTIAAMLTLCAMAVAQTPIRYVKMSGNYANDGTSDMIANTAHLYHVASRGIDQLTNIRMYAFDFPITDLGTRCFDVEYQMYVYFAQ